MKDFKFTLLDENLFLHPFKAIYWERHKILLLADLHLGKAAHFRKSGIPIPESIHQPDIERLNYLAERYKPARIIFLGDLFHSSVNNAWKNFRDFCESRIDIKLELIMGNHDILEHENYDFMEVHQDTLELHPFILSHKPLASSELKGYYNLCGHIHPSIRISGIAKQSVRVDCFFFGKDQGILPAFGNFTGNSRLASNTTDRIFAVTNQKIIPLFQK